MAKTLLKDCERQEARLKGGIFDEYDEMKNVYSEVHGLLVEADRIAEDALQVLDYASKKSLIHARYPQLDENSAGNARNT